MRQIAVTCVWTEVNGRLVLLAGFGIAVIALARPSPDRPPESARSHSQVARVAKLGARPTEAGRTERTARVARLSELGARLGEAWRGEAAPVDRGLSDDVDGATEIGEATAVVDIDGFLAEIEIVDHVEVTPGPVLTITIDGNYARNIPTTRTFESVLGTTHGLQPLEIPISSGAPVEIEYIVEP